jgi:CTP-dependent riboflavin kinase
MNFSGEVSSGLGRAHVFMAQTHYQEQFKLILGSGAWPGTLNVDLDREDLVKYQNLRVIAGLDEGEVVDGPEGIRIAGFERDGKSFGGATAFSGKISINQENWISCAVLIPDLTRHTKTAEIISSSFLREILPCMDGERVWLKFN